ncbi:hypothetical protein D3C83_262610 [compost metagenome]
MRNVNSFSYVGEFVVILEIITLLSAAASITISIPVSIRTVILIPNCIWLG